jgi:hypothetical protein
MLEEAQVDDRLRTALNELDQQAEMSLRDGWPTALSEKYAYLPYVLVRLGKKNEATLHVED